MTAPVTTIEDLTDAGPWQTFISHGFSFEAQPLCILRVEVTYAALERATFAGGIDVLVRSAIDQLSSAVRVQIDVELERGTSIGGVFAPGEIETGSNVGSNNYYFQSVLFRLRTPQTLFNSREWLLSNGSRHLRRGW